MKAVWNFQSSQETFSSLIACLSLAPCFACPHVNFEQADWQFKPKALHSPQPKARSNMTAGALLHWDSPPFKFSCPPERCTACRRELQMCPLQRTRDSWNDKQWSKPQRTSHGDVKDEGFCLVAIVQSEKDVFSIFKISYRRIWQACDFFLPTELPLQLPFCEKVTLTLDIVTNILGELQFHSVSFFFCYSMWNTGAPLSNCIYCNYTKEGAKRVFIHSIMSHLTIKMTTKLVRKLT